MSNTAVTSHQLDLLIRAVEGTEEFKEPIVEVGSLRGATTRTMALKTRRLVYAVDPYVGWGGSAKAYEHFCAVVGPLPNVKHIRKSSGEAAELLAEEHFSLVFIDAVHDYLNTWYDFLTWGALLLVDGLIAFHDVDDFPGTNVACQRILTRRKEFEIWAYCPNLAVFRKTRESNRS